MTIGDLMNALIEAVDCDKVDVNTEITFFIPDIGSYMDNFKSKQIEVRTHNSKNCVLELK